MIDPREALASGLESLRHHVLRSFLAMLGIIFGVGAVIAMLSIGAGAEKQALEIIDAMGLRNVVLKDKRFDRENELQEIRRKSLGLSQRDARAIRDAVPGVERVVAKIEVDTWKVLSPTGNRAKPRVLGVSADYPRLVKLPLREGRFFDQRDEEEYAPVCVIGDQVRRELFGFVPALGRPLKVNDEWLTVVGVLAPGGGRREIQGVTLQGTANDVDIRNQFVMEAFTVTVTGGLLGVAMGLAIAKGVATFAGWSTVVTLWSIALSVGVSAGVGLVFGIYPAMRAARLDPVEALRYE